MVSFFAPLRKFHSMAGDVAVAATTGFSADLTCQTLWEGKNVKELDFRRLASITTFSGLYIGSICNGVYQLYPRLASRLLQQVGPGQPLQLSSKSLGIFSTMIDNFVHVPLLYLPSYFVAIGYMQGRSTLEIQAAFQDEYVTTLTSCWGFWVPFMGLNFALLPVAHQVRAVAAGNFVWTMALDYMTRAKSKVGTKTAAGAPVQLRTTDNERKRAVSREVSTLEQTRETWILRHMTH